MQKLEKITTYLDKLLKIASFEDGSHNGLQVQNSGQVGKIACGVDADLTTFEAARERGANLLVVHHGISWGDSLKRITDMNYERIAYLVRNDMALYAAHLPLDAHPQYGNNALICRLLGLHNIRPFGNYRGQVIGFQGELPRAVTFDVLFEKVRKKLNPDIRTMPFGGKRIKRIAVISGGGGPDLLAEAARSGIDAFVSGEPTLAAWGVARDMRIHAVFAGHYATETLGVNALAECLQKRFKLPAEFIKLDVPY